ncbi:hypothetical protein [Gordonia sp. NB41Y]|uniref:hypothetical protein n=1 Tax=Gordonia sp. NB41Y TaxID=875808 RepID=UPI000346460F|nr:hypothetical protein [Gordonia sp. NB41Y]EMP10805.2 hypothetical protein ISGA_5067 [Gordonia sp. NB41Y]WLP88513.1 hypothetical protein Q9K23_12835 [Gordonia sp. NB41Y]
MSTYGFALIADLADVEDAERVLSQVRDVLAEDWDRSWGSDPFDQFASEVASGDGGARLTVLASMMLPNGHEDQFFAGTSGGRAVVCEDLDEYGVCSRCGGSPVTLRGVCIAPMSTIPRMIR